MLSLMTAALILSAATPPPGVDCTRCAEVCDMGLTEQRYPDDLRPEELSREVQHRSAEAEAAFNAGLAQDPAFGGHDVLRAIAGYKRATKTDPNNPQYRNYLAAALMRAGRYKEAIYNLRNAVRVVPTATKYRVNLGYAYHKMHNEPRALVHYMRALSLNSGDTRARLFAGYAMELLHMPDEAAGEFRRVLALDPDHAKAKRALKRVEAKLR